MPYAEPHRVTLPTQETISGGHLLPISTASAYRVLTFHVSFLVPESMEREQPEHGALLPLEVLSWPPSLCGS